MKAGEIIEQLCRELDELKQRVKVQERTIFIKKASTDDLKIWLSGDMSDWPKLSRWDVSREIDRREGKED